MVGPIWMHDLMIRARGSSLALCLVLAGMDLERFETVTLGTGFFICHACTRPVLLPTPDTELSQCTVRCTACGFRVHPRCCVRVAKREHDVPKDTTVTLAILQTQLRHQMCAGHSAFYDAAHHCMCPPLQWHTGTSGVLLMICID